MVNKIKHRTPYDRVSVKLDTSGDERLTKQEFKNSCNINHLMARHNPSGRIPVVNVSQEIGVAIPPGFNFQQAQDIQLRAKQAFNKVPASIRNRFGNDPAEFMEFVQNPENIDECRKMGLAPQKEVDIPPVDKDLSATTGDETS